MNSTVSENTLLTFFPVHKLGAEIDENGHIDRSEIEEKKRQEVIKKLDLTSLELILIKKVLIFLMKLVK